MLKKIFQSSVMIILFLFSSFSFGGEKPSRLNHYNNRNIIFWRSQISGAPNISGISSKYPIFISFRSFGGNPYGAISLVNQIRKLAKEVYSNTGEKMEFYFSDQCASACLLVLSGVNQLAIKGLLNLKISKTTQLMFHGAYIVGPDNERKFDLDYTKEFVDNLIKFGMSRTWVAEHSNLFLRHNADDIITIPADDLRLNNSGILEKSFLFDGGLEVILDEATKFMGGDGTLLLKGSTSF
jgi:hypothetical protein